MPLKGIQKYHSFRFATTGMGAVYMKEKSSGKQRCLQLLKCDIQIPYDTMSDEIPPAGLSLKQQQYLYTCEAVCEVSMPG